MKRLLALLLFAFLTLPGCAIEADRLTVELDTVTLDTRIQKNMNEIAFKMLNGSRIDKIIPVFYEPLKRDVNAHADIQKSIHIYKGVVRFLESDDELAAVIAHELAHAIELHKNFYQIIPMQLNSKAYEFQADKKGVDLMVNGGYNPVAMIVAYSKFMPQRYIDWVPVICTHPKTSRRLAAVYEYIYMKYPQYLANNAYKDNIYYQNFLLTSQANRKRFEAKAKNPNITARYK